MLHDPAAPGPGIKLAALVPVGAIDRFSYQYNSALVLENLSTYFDKVYVVSNSRKTQSLPFKSDRIVLVSDSDSWDKLDDRGEEVFSFNRLLSNLSRVAVCAQQDGMHFAVDIHINQYIDADNYSRLVKYCGRLSANSQPFGYLYKAYQLGNCLTLPDTALPWVLNLKYVSEYRFGCDSAFFNNRKYGIKKGVFVGAPFYIVDIFGEVTEADFLERYHCYLKYVGTAAQKPSNWTYWRDLYARKAKNKIIGPRTKLSVWGEKVLKNIPEMALIRQIQIPSYSRLLFISHRLRDIFRNYDNSFCADEIRGT